MASNAQYLNAELMNFQEHIKNAVTYFLNPKNTHTCAEIAYLYDISELTLRHHINAKNSHKNAAMN